MHHTFTRNVDTISPAEWSPLIEGIDAEVAGRPVKNAKLEFYFGDEAVAYKRSNEEAGVEPSYYDEGSDEGDGRYEDDDGTVWAEAPEVDTPEQVISALDKLLENGKEELQGGFGEHDGVAKDTGFLTELTERQDNELSQVLSFVAGKLFEDFGYSTPDYMFAAMVGISAEGRKVSLNLTDFNLGLLIAGDYESKNTPNATSNQVDEQLKRFIRLFYSCGAEHVCVSRLAMVVIDKNELPGYACSYYRRGVGHVRSVGVPMLPVTRQPAPFAATALSGWLDMVEN